MPGVPGTLFDFGMDTSDVFQSAVVMGCTITSSPSSFFLVRASLLRISEPQTNYAFLAADVAFRPPKSFRVAVGNCANTQARTEGQCRNDKNYSVISARWHRT